MAVIRGRTLVVGSDIVAAGFFAWGMMTKDGFVGGAAGVAGRTGDFIAGGIGDLRGDRAGKGLRPTDSNRSAKCAMLIVGSGQFFMQLVALLESHGGALVQADRAKPHELTSLEVLVACCIVRGPGARIERVAILDEPFELGIRLPELKLECGDDMPVELQRLTVKVKSGRAA